MLDEHLGYIADRVRLERYRQAIDSTLSAGLKSGVDSAGHDSITVIDPITVIDAGCGFGVLGLMCLEAGAAHVWGIDATAAIDVARETMDRAELGPRYTCIRAQTFNASVPQPVDLIICDHVGYFGFDYGIIAMIGDLRRRLLTPGGTIMPRRIRLMIAGTASADCQRKADGWVADGVPGAFHWLRQYGVNTKHACTLTAEDIATTPAALGEIDLTADNPEHFALKTAITAACDGTLNGLAGWFECELAQGVWMTNSPLADDRIRRGQVFLPFDQPLAVKAGDEIAISVSFRHDSGTIVWSAHDLRSGERRKQSTWNSLILDPAALDTSPERVPQLTALARARSALLGLIDGQRTAAQIEAAMLQDHPDLLPSAEAMRRFVRDELARNGRTASGA
ncbi:MAG: class I SAM-dependent methyltransferase [Novosphingobium sp.]